MTMPGQRCAYGTRLTRADARGVRLLSAAGGLEDVDGYASAAMCSGTGGHEPWMRTFYNADGVALPSTSHSVMGTQAASTPMNHGAGNDTYTRARIRLYSRDGKLSTLVHTSNSYRG